MAGSSGGSKVVARPAIPPPRVRKNLATLKTDDPILEFYRKAIAKMIALPIKDPLSWRYQAARHDYVRAQDPFANAADVLPDAAEQSRFWGKCEHGSWFFLPWHRMYLHYFERIVMKLVKAEGGPSDWALPYWNYSASDAARMLPEPYQSATLKDGSVNHLHVSQRDANANAGKNFNSAARADITVCLRQSAFSASAPATSFGGGPVSVSTHGGSDIGSLEGTPHGSIHVDVAGPTGFMRNFTKAPLDPIFWSHHCNIDRLWEVWLKRNPANKNPTDATWLTAVKFEFHDETGAIQGLTPSQVVDTRGPILDYVYDDISDPLGGPP